MVVVSLWCSQTPCLGQRHVALSDGDGGGELVAQLLAVCVAWQVKLAEAGVGCWQAGGGVVRVVQAVDSDLQV